MINKDLYIIEIQHNGMKATAAWNVKPTELEIRNMAAITFKALIDKLEEKK